MKCLKASLCIVLITISVHKVCGQQKVLTVGDSFPMEKLAVQLNVPTKSLAGKPLILNFWSINCSGCIKELIELKKIQQQFGEAVNIVPVTRNTKSDAIATFRKIKHPIPDLPMIYNDSIFSVMLPYRSVPHFVWLNGDGVVRHVTNGDSISSSNIARFAQGAHLNLPEKIELLDFDKNVPLWTEGEGRFQNHLSSYSYFMEEIEHVDIKSGSVTYDTENKVSGFKAINTRLSYLYYLAAIKGKYSRLPEYNRTILEVPSADIPALNRRLCYESWMKEASRAKLFEVLEHDLQKTFPYAYAIEKRQTKCFVLEVATKREGDVTGKTQKDIEPIYDYHGVKAGGLASEFESRFKLELPVLTSIEAKERFDLKLYAPLNTVDDLNKQLESYGLRLSEKVQELDMLVISKQK